MFRSPRTNRRATGCLACVLASAVGMAGAWNTPPALASTISLLDDPDSDGTFIDYVAAPGEANQFVILGIPTAGRLAVQDGFGDVSIAPTDPCTTGLPGESTSRASRVVRGLAGLDPRRFR